LSKTKALSKTKEPLKVTQEKLPGSQLGLEIEISAERSHEAYEQTITQFMRSAQIPGFRRGKVPRQVVLQQFGGIQLKAKTLEDLVESTFNEALKQEKIDALGNFQLKSAFEELLTQFEPGATLTYSASVEIPPEATLKRYTKFKIQAQEVKYDPTQMDRIIDEQRVSRATLVPVEDRVAQPGDVVQLDFSGQYFVDDAKTELKEIEGGSATDFELELTEGQFIPGFIDGIFGMSPEETKEIEVTFPEGYFQADLAGKPALFNVNLKELKTKELPDIDDGFVQEISEFQTVAELRQFLEKRYQKEAQDKTDANVDTALLDALVAELEVELPEILVSNEVSFLINQMAQRFQGQGIDVNKLFNKETIPGLRDRFRDEAVVRVKRTLALAQVAQQESITVETEALEKRFQEVLTQIDDGKIDRARLREALEEELLQQKVIGWLKENSEVELFEKAESEASTETVDVAATTVAAESPSLEAVSEPEQPTAEETETKTKPARRTRTTKSKTETGDEA
jgi:trigger factor